MAFCEHSGLIWIGRGRLAKPYILAISKVYAYLNSLTLLLCHNLVYHSENVIRTLGSDIA
jgi:hypothetical protein